MKTSFAFPADSSSQPLSPAAVRQFADDLSLHEILAADSPPPRKSRRHETSRSLGVYDADGDILDQYLFEVSRTPLLTVAQEIAVAKRVRRGDEDAMRELVKRNLRFVISVAKKYQNRGMPLTDLIGEGNVGLMTAAKKFDPEQGVKFISYAVWWIRQSILQALADQSRIVRVPLNRAGEMHRIGRRTSALQQELGRDPTAVEIAEGMDLDVVEVERTLAISRAHLSLDAPTSTGDDARLLDHIADARGRGADADAIDHARTECIEAVLGSLREREARIVRLYFGLDSVEAYTLEQIGEMMGITRERVRQIKDKALMRLRLASEGHALDSFLG